MQIVAPHVSGVRISPIDTSNKNEQNWNTLESGVMCKPRQIAAELDAIALCSTTTPFGVPVEPEVYIT